MLVQAANVLESQPDAKFWAGERYYRRQHRGPERENRQAALAYLAGARPDIITENGYVAKSNVDVRGDIGGTKTALAVFSEEQGPHTSLAESEVHSADYGSLESIAKEFLARLG